MHCPECGFDSPPQMKFCGMCGTRLTRVCLNCGFASPLDYVFCGQCGTRLAQQPASVQPIQLRFPAETFAEAPFDDGPQSALRTGPSIPPPPARAAVSARPGPTPARMESERLVEEGPSLPRLAPVQLEGERRTTTVILADVKGSTDLFERIGTEAWVRMMNHVFRILESEIYRYGGEVDQFRGDGLVAFFGAVSAHEDDPERAVLAALAMQEAIRSYAAELAEREGIDLQLRVGVNTGEVIVASIGDSRQHSEDTAMGEAVALASRMETAAEPGTVLVSENTYQLIQSQFVWQALGEISVQGVSRPIPVYRPLAPRDDAQRSLRLETYGLPSLLVGRDEQFAALTSRVDDLRAGHGGVVLLTGREGMGKSHLVAQVQQHVVRDDALLAEASNGGAGAFRPLTWLRGQCRSYEQMWPYSMWLDLGRRWLGVRTGEPRAETRERLRRQAEALWGDQMAEHYPYLAKILSLPLEDKYAQWVDGLGAEALRQQFFLAVRSWVEAIAKSGPLALVFEDVHWADAASLELLEYCLPLCDQEAVLWLITSRAARTSAVQEFRQRMEAAYAHRLISLTLPPLTEAQSGEMIERLIGSQTLPAETRTLIVDRAEGNPYYIEELIRSLIGGGALVRDAQTGQWDVARAITSLDLPETLRGLLLARIDDLSPGDRRVLQMAAVIGSVFWENVLRELVGADSGPGIRQHAGANALEASALEASAHEASVLEASALGRHLAALERAQFIREHGKVPKLGMEYRFQSSLIRDAAYEGILSAQRVTYHLQVADHLAQLFGEEILAQYYGLVAYHYRCAEEPKRELFYTLSAAERAQSIYAHAEAQEYYSRVLDLLDRLGEEDAASLGRLGQDWRLEALKGLGQVCFGTGKLVEAEERFREAVALAQEMGADAEHPLATSERVRIYYWLGETLHWQHRHEEQIRIAEEGLALLADEASPTEATESVEAALMNQEIAVGYLSMGDNAKFREFTQRTARFLERLPYSEELRPAYDHVARMYAYDKKDVSEAEKWLHALERHATHYHDLRALGDVHYSAAGILEQSGDLRGALSRQQKALELFRKIGDAKHQGWCLGRLGGILISLGNLQEAEKHARAALETAERGGNEGEIAEAHWRLGQVFLSQGAWERAVDAFQQALHFFQETKDRTDEVGAIYALGRAYLAHKDREAALRQFQETVDRTGLDFFGQHPFVFALALNAGEEAYGEPEAFRALCCRWREEHPQLTESTFVQWFLEPTVVGAFGQAPLYHDEFADLLSPDWTWGDPFDDCWFRVRNGLEIYAANGRDLWHINLSAPRVLRPVSADLAIQTVCGQVSDAKLTTAVPGIGGLLIWKDRENYLRLDVGTRGQREISFGGCLENRDVIIGRGLLPFGTPPECGPQDEFALRSGGVIPSLQVSGPPTGKVCLRLERRNEQVSALCSLDGGEWFTVGQVAFPVKDPVQVGLYANGNIDPLIYPGVYADGTAIRFESFQLWKDQGLNLRPSSSIAK